MASLTPNRPSRLITARRLLVLVAWLGTLAVSFLGGVYAYRNRARLRAMFGSVQGGQIIQTNLYNLGVRKLSVPAEGRDGGIAALDGGVLFANRLGATWYVDSAMTLRPLPLTVPVNVAEFEADPYNANTNRRDQFAVKDILIQTLSGGVRLLASHNYWYADRDCYVLRVSSLETTLTELLAAGADINQRWRTVYETTPCRELALNPNGVNRNPTLGAGGRLAAYSDREILVTVGGFGPETALKADAAATQDLTSSYGKTNLFDLETGTTRVFTVGHRNPQGLAIASGPDVWLTEHAARGGDELNYLIDGRDYGYPRVSYGTEYESMVWSPNPRQGRHDGFEKPMLAWVPSIGISQVMVIERPLFEHWRGDVMVSSLAARTLFRVRVEDGRVVFVEPILVGHRIRDVAETADGTLVLKTEDNFLIYLRPLDARSADDPDLAPSARGQLLAGDCSGCHVFTRDGADGIGPVLWGVIGRPIGSRPGFGYTGALKSLGGEWTPSLLRAFLSNPDSTAPGTSMSLTRAYREQQLNDLIAYLETLR